MYYNLIYYITSFLFEVSRKSRSKSKEGKGEGKGSRWWEGVYSIANNPIPPPFSLRSSLFILPPASSPWYNPRQWPNKNSKRKPTAIPRVRPPLLSDNILLYGSLHDLHPNLPPISLLPPLRYRDSFLQSLPTLHDLPVRDDAGTTDEGG